MAVNIRRAVAKVEKELIPFEDATPYVRIMVYGRNGSGKTRFGASGPDVVLLDINEEGTKSVRKIRGKAFQAKRWEHVLWFYWFLKYGRHRFRTVVIDNLTTMQVVCIRHILKEKEDRDPHTDPKMMTTPLWNKLKETMGPVIMDLRNLPMNVVFIAQERVDRNAEGDASERLPDMSPGVRGIATGAVDIIGRMAQKQVRAIDKRTRRETVAWKTLMYVGPHDEFLTKDRTFQLGQVVVNPTMARVIKAAESMEDEE